MRAVATRLTADQARFVEHMSELGDIRAATKLAGLSYAHGYTLIKQPHILAEIQTNVRRAIVSSAPLALKLIVDLVKDDTVAHKTRLDAAWKLTQMAGHVAPRAAVEKPGDAPLHEMSTDQLRELAGRLEDEIAGRARPVNDPSSANPAPQEPQAIDVIG